MNPSACNSPLRRIRTSTLSPISNYKVIAENVSQLLSNNKPDRKIINVDPKVRSLQHQPFNKITDLYFIISDSRDVIPSG